MKRKQQEEPTPADPKDDLRNVAIDAFLSSVGNHVAALTVEALSKLDAPKRDHGSRIFGAGSWEMAAQERARDMGIKEGLEIARNALQSALTDAGFDGPFKSAALAKLKQEHAQLSADLSAKSDALRKAGE